MTTGCDVCMKATHSRAKCDTNVGLQVSLTLPHVPTSHWILSNDGAEHETGSANPSLSTGPTSDWPRDLEGSLFSLTLRFPVAPVDTTEVFQ